MSSGLPKVNLEWRRHKSGAFKLDKNSTARRVVHQKIFGKSLAVYANANVSIYSRQACNAACGFCVENLRPASRGVELSAQKRIEPDDSLYFSALKSVLEELASLDLTYSVTGGEPSIDPRLPRTIAYLKALQPRKMTLTTNGSGLLQVRSGKRVIDSIVEGGFHHLNISIASPDQDRNRQLMRLKNPLSNNELSYVTKAASAAGCSVRFSCVLLASETNCLEKIVHYVEFARSLGVKNVIFRQLMKSDPETHAANAVVRYTEKERVALEPLLNEISNDSRFQFQRQVVGYYYYVEVWRLGDVDVVFEEADLAQLEREKRQNSHLVHELIFHPNARLASTWQPWDGIIGPS